MVLKWGYPNIRPPQRQKPEWHTASIFDETHAQSEINRSHFRGCLNLALIFGTIFLCTKPIINFMDTGHFVDPHLYNTFKADLLWVLMVWPLFFLWSFTSLIIQKLMLMGMSPSVAVMLQHLTESGLFIFSTVIILYYDWCGTHTTFVIMQACVHFMKMHSYSTVNRDYRLQYLEAKKINSECLSNYPNNITFKDFVVFMFTPWIVYEEYPRRQTRSFIFIIRKSLITLGCFFGLYIHYTESMLFWINEAKNLNFLELVLRQMLPSGFFMLVGFYTVFENMNNVFAQLTYLDDRGWYEDWWSSTTYQEFNRKWNKPVHFFLSRHVYLEMIVRWKTSKSLAQFTTFTFSALLHQLLLGMIFREVKPIFFSFIILQVPLIYMTRWMQGTRIGNYFYWIGILLGPSLIISLYLKSQEATINPLHEQAL